ncbi:MAG: lipocalin family protein [Muribaculaceae bacterium]|nr:lipocalin family protein [Muribaculaceae bacterium]
MTATYTIENNGKFYYISQIERNGTWHLSGNKLVLKYSDGDTDTCTVSGNILIINGSEYEKF